MFFSIFQLQVVFQDVECVFQVFQYIPYFCRIVYVNERHRNYAKLSGVF